MKSPIIAFAALVLVAGAGGAAAQEPAPADTAGADRNQPDAAGNDISGFKFGAGIAVTLDFGGLERIEDAEVVNGVVRVNDENDVLAGLAAEAHFFFKPSTGFWGVDKKDWGHGPFFAVQTGGDTFLESVALGWMVGFRPPNSSESFNIGLGIAVHPNVQTLGDGIERNLPLPAGETEIRYREEAQWGAVILFSRTF